MNGCFSLAVTESMSPVSSPETIQLSEEEAEQLAEELKQQLRQGERLAGDTQAIERMVAGLGDRRGLLRLTFAESLGTVGSAAVPALCTAMCDHENVTVRRAAAKTLTLISDQRALPFLLKALLNDADPVVQGSAVGAWPPLAPLPLTDCSTSWWTLAARPCRRAWPAGAWLVGARAPEALRKAAQSPHAQIRTAAIAALGDQIQNLGDEDARQLLTNALRDPMKTCALKRQPDGQAQRKRMGHPTAASEPAGRSSTGSQKCRVVADETGRPFRDQPTPAVHGDGERPVSCRGAETCCESAQQRRLNTVAGIVHVVSHPWCSRRALHAQLREIS